LDIIHIEKQQEEKAKGKILALREMGITDAAAT
jgi:hypothetical protein